MSSEINIKKCPLIGLLHNGKAIAFKHDAVIDNCSLFSHKITKESIAEISRDLFLRGYDLKYITIDENRIRYQEVGIL